METFNEAKNVARVLAGLKGGPFNSPLNLNPPMRFVDGWPSEVTQKLQSGSIPQSTPIDVWNSRSGK